MARPTVTAQPEVSNFRRLTRNEKYALEDAAQAFCDGWDFEFVGLWKDRRYSWYAEIRMSEDAETDLVDFVICTCGEAFCMFPDETAMGKCEECGKDWDGSEVIW